MKHFLISLIFLVPLLIGIAMETPGTKFPILEFGILAMVIVVLSFLSSRRYDKEGGDEHYGSDDD